MKPFDENFADNVREAFDNYQEPVDEQAWAGMKSRLQPGSNRRIVAFIPLWAKAAAAVLLLVTVGLVTLNQLQRTPVMQAEHREMIEAEAERSEVPRAQRFGIEDEVDDEVKTDAERSEVEQSEIPGLKGFGIEGEVKVEVERRAVRETVVEIPAHTSQIAQLEMQRDATEEVVSISDSKPESISEVEPATDVPLVLPPIIRGEVYPAVVAYPAVKQEGTTNFRFGAGPMKAFVPGEISQGMGFSAGLTGDWALAHNVSISTGGAIVYNQFRFDEMAFTGGRGDYYADASLPNIGAANRVNVLYQREYTDFEFYAIDIPVNVSYKLRDAAKSQVYVSAGISSFFYLMQSYSSYGEVMAEMTFNGYSQTNFASVTYDGSFSPFDRFDFARFLNLSAGYVIKREEYQFIIEPFVKMPFGEVTSFNLDMGMAGLTLKYGFSR